jgi:hypothetical protein
MAGVKCWELDRWSLKIIGNRDCGSAALQPPKNCGDETRAGQNRLDFPSWLYIDRPPTTDWLVPTHNMVAIYLPYGAFGRLAASQVIKGGSQGRPTLFEYPRTFVMFSSFIHNYPYIHTLTILRRSCHRRVASIRCTMKTGV